jgi:hypothetical protein
LRLLVFRLRIEVELALARVMLSLGIAATIGANIAYGAGYKLLGALISAWPAVAFIGSVEIAMQLVRRARLLHIHQRAEGAGGCGAGGPDSVRGVGRGRAAAEPADHGRPVRPVPPQGQPAHR